MKVSIEQIKHLRERTGVSMTECKKALEEANGDINKAIEILRKKGELKAMAKAEREVKEGIITAYIHNNKKKWLIL